MFFLVLIDVLSCNSAVSVVSFSFVGWLHFLQGLLQRSIFFPFGDFGFQHRVQDGESPLDGSRLEETVVVLDIAGQDRTADDCIGGVGGGEGLDGFEEFPVESILDIVDGI